MTWNKGVHKPTRQGEKPVPVVLMLLMNAYCPDPRVRQEALALLRLGCHVRILAWDRDLINPIVENSEGINIERVYLRSMHGRGSTQLLFYVFVYLKMLWRGWRTTFDVVHCHDLDTLPIGFILGRLMRKPVVYDAHESFADMLGTSVHAYIKGLLLVMEDALMKRIALLITVGERLRRHFEGRGACRSVVIGNWKSSAEFAHSREQNLERRRALGIPDSALVVVCITQLLPDRKLEELLDAILCCPEVYLLVAGKGVLEGMIRERALSCPRVIYLGFVPTTAVAAYTCAGDVVYYGFSPENGNSYFSAPNKLFEALAAGRPLITGDFGEIADIVRQAACGIVLPEYSAIEISKAINTLQDLELRKKMADNARLFGLLKINWETGEEILHREYRALLAEAGLPAHPSGQAGVESMTIQEQPDFIG